MRVKRGFAGRRRHKKLLKRAEGFRGRKKNCFKIAKRLVQKAMRHATVHRKAKKRDFRRLWIVRINAASRECGLSYNRLIAGLVKANITLDRKVLADLALNEPNTFKAIAERAKAALS